MALDWVFTLQILLLAVIAFWVITAWDAALDLTLIKYLNLDPDSIIAHIIIGVIATIILIILLLIFGLELHDLLGIAENVDAQLTGHPEVIVDGKLVSY